MTKGKTAVLFSLLALVFIATALVLPAVMFFGETRTVNAAAAANSDVWTPQDAAVAIADEPQTEPQAQLTRPAKIRCEGVCETAKRVHGVRDCRVLCFGRVTLVALKLRPFTSSREAERIADEVGSAIRAQHPRFDRVYVSTSSKAFNALDRFDKRQIEEMFDLFGVDMADLPHPGLFHGRPRHADGSELGRDLPMRIQPMPLPENEKTTGATDADIIANTATALASAANKPIMTLKALEHIQMDKGLTPTPKGKPRFMPHVTGPQG